MKLPRPFVLKPLLLVACLSIGTYAMRLRAQSTTQTPTRLPVPQWQIDAGGKAAFDVASVKLWEPSSGPPHTNINLGPGDGPPPLGGYFSATMQLPFYIVFAYKLSSDQFSLMRAQLPGWAIKPDRSSFFAIEARANGNPTRDQMRLMMQSLLADRFKLAVHFETRQLPVYALVLAKPGKTGPRLTPHRDDPRCSDTPSHCWQNGSS